MPLQSFAFTLIKAMRPRQWTKNALLLAGLFLSSRRLLDPVSVKRALSGFLIFCLLSGAVYLLNDILDRKRDRLHPRKRLRPIASGELSVPLAALSMVVITAAALAGAFFLSLYFGMCAVAYLVLMIPYSLVLKEVYLIDTLVIAMGFIIRAVSGVIVLRTPEMTSPVPLTSWFIICVMFLALFLAFAKRRSERVTLDAAAAAFRPVLTMYSLEMMDKVIVVCAAGAILSYVLYVTSLASPWSMLTTLPFVLYGIFRYLHLIYNKQAGEAPEIVLTTDMPLLCCVLLWALTLMMVFFPGHP